MTDPERGLDPEQAERRLHETGPNELIEHRDTPAWKVLLRQFKSPLVGILLVAAIVAGVFGDTADAIAIAVIVSINATIGFVQEQRAAKAMANLRSLTAPRARVRRGGELLTIPAREVVVGDLLMLEAGDVVAADARVVLAHALTTNEAALTGESMPVDKRPEPAPQDAPLAERHDHVFMGTAVASGTGAAEVVAIGMGTEIGRIAKLLGEEHDDETPLQRRIDRVGKMLLLVCVVLVAVVAGLGFVHGMGATELLMSSISLAVAAVPEGLPAIITIALALGMQRMAAQRVLVRRLAAVETLGSVTVICTDKTGTLTTGVMSVRGLWSPSEGGEQALLEAAAACCDAELTNHQSEGKSEGEGEKSKAGDSGDTTELAILRAARERGIERMAIERANPRVLEHPFSTKTRNMAVLRVDGRAYVKGAVEMLVARARPDSALTPEAVLAEAELMAARGLRVLAVGVRPPTLDPSTGAPANWDPSGESRDLELIGLIGLADPPREVAREAITRCRSAGVQVVMITGDHPATAQAIARELGLIDDDTDAAEVAKRVRARVTAEQKTMIVRELRQRGEVVAMSGDGVNDAPAIREADVGLAMGETATEVTREASDMVLVNDDLSSVLTAIREGRVIYENIRKTIVYLLGGNFSELGLMLVAAALGMPFPLLPLHLLWINLVTEPAPGLTLAVDKAEDDVLDQPPRDPKEPLLGKWQWALILGNAGLQTLLGFAVYYWMLEIEGSSLETARSMAFATMVCAGLLRAFAFRSPRHLLWEVGPFSNPWLVGVILLSLGMQLGLYQLEFTRDLFSLAPLSWSELGIALGLGFVPVSLLELGKLGVRWVRRARASAARG